MYLCELGHDRQQPARTKYDPTAYLIKEEKCGNCSAVLSKLQKCTRCKCVCYCNRDCQKQHYPLHKQFCLEYKRLSDALQEEKENLEMENEDGSLYWSSYETQEYCAARCELANHILLMANCDDSKRLYELALAHLMEIMRLCHPRDDICLHEAVPFILLALNRDSDAYNFTKSWMLNASGDNGCFYGGSVIKDTKEGDWLYLKNQDIHEDVFAVYPVNGKACKDIGLPFLATLSLIKIRIVCKLNLILMQVHETKKYLQSLKLELCDIDDVIVETVALYLSGGNQKYIKSAIETQEQYADQCTLRMGKENVRFVEAILDPQPLQKHVQASYGATYFRGSAMEAYEVLKKCGRLFERTPGALTLDSGSNAPSKS